MLFGGAFTPKVLEEVANFFGVTTVPAFFPGHWRIFLTEYCFTESRDVARAAMWHPYMSCNMVCDK